MEDRDGTKDAFKASMSASQSEQFQAAAAAAPSVGQSAFVSRRQRILSTILSPDIHENNSKSQRQLSPVRSSSRRSRSPSFVAPAAIQSQNSATVTASAKAAADITPTSSRRRRNAIDSTNPRVNPFCDPSNLPAVQPATPNLPRSAIIAAQTGPARFRADPRRLEKPPFQQAFNAQNPSKTIQAQQTPQLQLPYGADFSNYSSSSSNAPDRDNDVVAFPVYDESTINAELSFSSGSSPTPFHDADPRSSPPISKNTLAALPQATRSRSRHISPAPPSTLTPPKRARAGTRDAGSPYRTLPPLERPRFG